MAHALQTLTVGAVRLARPEFRLAARSLANRYSSLATIIGSFKSAVTRRVNEMRGTPAVAVWQRGYRDHVVER